MIELADESKKQERIDMIREALKEKAPLTYSELETSGQLQSFLEGREAELTRRRIKRGKKQWQLFLTSSILLMTRLHRQCSQFKGGYKVQIFRAGCS
jgi:hypothetical protein